MKNRISLLFLTLVLTVGSLLAQHGHRTHGLEMTDEMKTELGLNAEQSAALDKLHQETKTALTVLHERTDLDHEGKRATAREIHQATKAQVAEILTAEQLAVLKELHQAQRQKRQELMASVDRKALRTELREYRKTEIDPVMRAQRLQLEEELSAEDKNQLTEIRTTLQAARETAKAAHRERKEQHTEARGEEGKPHGERGHHKGAHYGKQLNRLAENHPTEFATLSAMVERYNASITRLLEDLTPQRAEWEAAQKAIMDRHTPAELQREHPRHRRGHANENHAEKAALARKIQFLLKDAEREEESPSQEPADQMAIRTFPNPATNATTLTFQLLAATTMRIDLRDEKGNLVKNITREQFNIGEHQLPVDLTELQNGTYYFTLNSRSLSAPQSIKLIVVK